MLLFILFIFIVKIKSTLSIGVFMFMKQNSSHKALWELYDNCVSVSDLLFLCVCKHRNKFRFVEVFFKELQYIRRMCLSDYRFL